jgi:hypothetical protein
MVYAPPVGGATILALPCSLRVRMGAEWQPARVGSEPLLTLAGGAQLDVFYPSPSASGSRHSRQTATVACSAPPAPVSHI